MYEVPERKKKSGGMFAGFPELDRLQKTKLISLCHVHPTYARAFHPRFDMTEYFSKDCMNRRDGVIPSHTVIQIIGQTGSGKSTAAILIALMWIAIKKENIKICMEQHKLLLKAKTSKMGDVLILDEQPKRHGIGSNREESELTNLEEVTRKYKLSFIFVSPTPRVHKAAHYWLRTIFMDTERRITRLALIDPQTLHCLGYIEIKVPEDMPMREEYDRIKDEFIKKVIEGKMRGGYLEDYSHRLMKKQEYKEARTLKQKRIIATKEFPTLTKNEIDHLVEYARMIELGIIEKK